MDLSSLAVIGTALVAVGTLYVNYRHQETGAKKGDVDALRDLMRDRTKFSEDRYNDLTKKWEECEAHRKADHERMARLEEDHERIREENLYYLSTLIQNGVVLRRPSPPKPGEGPT
jgi:hypothetical protein